MPVKLSQLLFCRHDLEEVLERYQVRLPKTFGESAQIQLPNFQQIKLEKYYKTSTLSFANLETLTSEIESFLKPILRSWHLWPVYATSSLFRAYFECFFRKQPTSDVAALGKTLEMTAKLLTEMLLSDEVTLQKITVDGSVKLDDTEEHLNLSTELCNISESLKVDVNKIPEDRIAGLEAVIDLIQVAGFVHVICNVCRKFQLVNCTNTSNFKRLNEIATLMVENSEERNRIDPSTALQHKLFIHKQLYPCNQSLQCLFEQLDHNLEFYRLVREKFYEGATAPDVEKSVSVTRSFRQLLEVITQQLQHEEYEEQVLNHLYPAFQYVLPFMDRDQSFNTLMEQVSKLKSPSNFQELNNVRHNMNQIKQWFEQTEVGGILGFCIE